MIQLDSTAAKKFAVHLEGYEGLGGELVRNGDFSQLGTDLVENGGFDELGTDVITNGSFATDTDWTKGNGWSIGDNKATSTQALGSEEVTNGDFSDTTAGNISMRLMVMPCTLLLVIHSMQVIK